MKSAALPLSKQKPSPEIVTLQVLWTGWMYNPYRSVRVIRDDAGTLAVITDDNEILIGVDPEAVHHTSGLGVEEGPEISPRCRDCGHFFDRELDADECPQKCDD